MLQSYTFLLRKTIRKETLMRLYLTMITSVFLLMQVHAHTWAQPYVSLKPGEMTLKQLFDEIKEQTDYTVFYSSNKVNDNQTVYLKGDRADMRELLDQSLEGLSLSYVIKEKTIVIIENPAPVLQQQIVTGRVTASDGSPLASASITVKGTNRTVTSGEDGSFQIEAGPQDVLVISFVGYQTQEQPVRNRPNIQITLQEMVNTVDEVVVVAFGTAKRSTYTGSAATIGTETFEHRPITGITQALAGTTPGLQVGTTNGQPGSAPTLRIRGIGSFNAGNSPLIILDGMPYDNAFSSINPNDVESVTVLKDASSAALYGARGANGVLLITTKKGQQGKPRVDAKYNVGFTSRQSSDYERLDDRGFMELYWEAHRNGFLLNGVSESEANSQAGAALLAGLGYNPYLMDADQLFDSQGRMNPAAVNHWKEDTDWYGALTQVGKRHDANLSISGGNERTDYYTSLGYMNEEGFIIGSVFNRISAKSNVNSQVASWLKLGANLNLAQSESGGQQNETSGSISNPFRATRNLGPIFPIHLHDPATGEYILDADGNKIPDFGNGWTSPDGTIVISGRDAFANSNHPFEVHNIYNGYLRQTINVKGYADATLMEGLKLTINGGLGNNMYRSWAGGYAYEQKGTAGSSSKNISQTGTWTFQQLLNYEKNWGRHYLSALAGHESYQYQYHYMSTSMKTQSIPGDNFEYVNFTEINALPNSYTHNYRVEGYLSRVSYDYDNKYFASASYRKDGSSRFYKDVRWGDFWSIGAGWALERERFMDDVDFVNALKLRASYGVVGNDDLSSYYPWRATYAPNDNGDPGYVQSSLGNRELTWETSKNFDVATEFSLFDNRFHGTVEYFYRVSSDLLFSVPKPISSGVTNVDVNAGSMSNEGMEITLDGEVVRSGDFSLRLNAHTTYLKNLLIDLPLDPYPTSIYKIEEGHSRYDFWLRQYYGVNPENGYNLFQADLEQYEFTADELKEIDGVMYTENVEKALYAYSGSAMPKLTGGLGAQVGWKNFNLKFNFYYQLGGKFYDSAYRSFMTGSTTYQSQHVDLVNRWRKPGDVTDVARVTMGTDRVNIEASNTTKWLVTSNMLELTNVNLSYTIPPTWLASKGVSNAMVYFSADNLFLLTARQGLYPRRSFYSGYLANSDVYPPSTIMSFGLSLTF